MSFPPAPPPAKKPSLFSAARLKKLRWPAAVVALTGGPFAYFESGEWTKGAASAWENLSTASSSSPTPQSLPPLTSAGMYGTQSTGVGTAETPTALPEIFNFDITPIWVMSRWPEVALGMADVNLTGHRVMLVTGPQPRDLAGSLTFYFDHDQRLQRIRFEGVTGDPRPLVAEMALRHRFVRCKSDVPGTDIYQVHRDGKAVGDLRIRSVPVVRSHSVLGRYSVSLAVDRPQ